MYSNPRLTRSAIIFVSAVLSMLFTASAAMPADKSREIRKTVDFASGGSIKVETVSGEITVTSWNTEEVEVVATIDAKKMDRDEAEELLPQFKLNLRKQGRRLTIEIEEPDNDGDGGIGSLLRAIMGGWNKRYSISYDVKVPRESDVKAETVNGTIRISGITGNAHGGTVNGNVRLEDNIGKASGEAVNGSVTIREHRGSINGEAVNGTLRIEVQELDDRDDINLETVNGSINLALAPDIKASISIETLTGGHSFKNLSNFEGSGSKREYRGTLNGGGADIDMETLNGRITVEEL
jgi:DUF4097 and DUF4098 domain-containing protein YvlB